MKRATLLKRFGAGLIATALMTSFAACSSDSDKDSDKEEETTVVETTAEETTEESVAEETSLEETTTVEETTVETSEETTTTEATTEETTEATTTVIDDPAVAMYSDPEVKEWALKYINNGFHVEYMDHDGGESFWGTGTNMVEGFGAGDDGDSLFTLDYVMKFPDHETADAFLTELDGSAFGHVERTDNGDGSCTFEIEGGMWTGSVSVNNVLVLIFNEDFEG